LNFSQGGKQYGASLVTGEWTYVRTDDTVSTHSIREEQEETVILPQGENFVPVFSIAPDSASFLLTGEGFKTVSGPLSELNLTPPEKDTYLTLVIHCKWSEENHEAYYGVLEYTFHVFYDIPTHCSIDGSQGKAGESFIVRVAHSSAPVLAVTPTFTTADQVRMTKEEDGWLVTVPIPVGATPGEYSILLMGSDVEYRFSVEILP
jgi:hypothetical protein